MPYIYDEEKGKYIKIDRNQIIEDTVMEGFLQKYKYELENGFGYLYYDSGSVMYEDRKINIKVNKRYSTYDRAYDIVNDDDFFTKEVLLKDYSEMEKEKSNGNVVLFIEDKFKVFKLSNHEYFDYETKTVKVNRESLFTKVFGEGFSIGQMVSRIRERGFSFIVNGVKYYQQFNDNQDTTFFTNLLNYKPSDRIMKLFIHRDPDDSSKNDYKVIEGITITDEFINNILIYFKYYNFYVKEVTKRYYLQYIENEENIDKLFLIKSTYIDDIDQIIFKEYVNTSNNVNLNLSETEKLLFTEKEKMISKIKEETKSTEEVKEEKKEEKQEEKKEVKKEQEVPKENKESSPQPKSTEEKKEEKENKPNEKPNEKSSEENKGKEEKKEDKEQEGSKPTGGSRGASIGFDKDWNSLFTGEEAKLFYGIDGKPIKKK